MSNVTLYEENPENVKANKLAGIKTELYKGPEVVIEGNESFSQYGFEEIYLQVLQKYIPIYLLDHVKFYFHETNQYGDHYTEMQVSGEIEQQIHLSFSLNRIASTIYIFLRYYQRLAELGIEQSDKGWHDDGANIEHIEDLITNGLKIEEIKSILAEIENNPIFKAYFNDLINESNVFHELMHAFINRIYPNDPKTVATKEQMEEATNNYVEFITEIAELVKKEGVEIDIEKTDMYVLTEVSNKVVRKFFKAHPDFAPEKVDLFFKYMYSQGVQEVWIRLLEARLNIIREIEHDNDPAMKYDRSFRRVYRSGESIVKAVLGSYFGECIQIPLEFLEELRSVDPLTIEFIDKFIHEKIFPLMDISHIQEVKKEILN